MAFICPVCQVRVPNGNEDQHNRGRRHQDNKLKAAEKIPQVREGNMKDIVPEIMDIIDTISKSLEVVAVQKVTQNRDKNMQCLVQDIVDIIDTMSKSVELFSNGCSSTSGLARGANESPCIAKSKKDASRTEMDMEEDKYFGDFRSSMERKKQKRDDVEQNFATIDGSSTGAETVDPNCGTNKPSLYSEVATMTTAVAHKGHGTVLRGATRMSLASKPVKTISKRKGKRQRSK